MRLKLVQGKTCKCCNQVHNSIAWSQMKRTAGNTQGIKLVTTQCYGNPGISFDCSCGSTLLVTPQYYYKINALGSK